MSYSSNTLTAPEEKKKLRQELKSFRLQVSEDLHNTASWRVANYIRQVIAQTRPSIVALYMAQAGEIDLSGLVKDLRHNNDMDIELALPRVAKKGAPLVFNKWFPGARMDYDKYGLPCAVGPEVIPGLIVMPCLGFDIRGNRLGMGGGYYDRALRTLGQPATTVATAFSMQEVMEIPTEYHDQQVDYVATERELIRCR